MKPADARVVLTGATGGIGRAVAAELVASGAAVLLVGRDPQRLELLARELQPAAESTTPRVAWHACDLADTRAPMGLSRAAAAWGANVLVNNAGVPSLSRFVDLPAHHVEAVLRVNLLAPMLLTHALLPGLLERARAQVIHMGSVLGRMGLPGTSVYSASKFGLRGFAESLRRELAETAVTVQYLGPRATRTDFNDARAQAWNRATGSASDAPATVARALLGLLESEAAERFLGFPESLAVRLNGLAPTLLDGAFARHRRALPMKHAASPVAHAATTHAADRS